MKWLTSILDFLRMLLPVIGKRQDYKVLTYEVKKDKIQAETLVKIEKAKADLTRATARLEVVAARAEARTEKRVDKIERKQRKRKKDMPEQDSPPINPPI